MLAGAGNRDERSVGAGDNVNRLNGPEGESAYEPIAGRLEVSVTQLNLREIGDLEKRINPIGDSAVMIW